MTHAVFHAINVFMGTNSQNSWGYMFWSGFAFTLPWWFGMLLWYKHNKCYNCYRLGRHVPNYHHLYCKHHTPHPALDLQPTISQTELSD